MGANMLQLRPLPKYYDSARNLDSQSCYYYPILDSDSNKRVTYSNRRCYNSLDLAYAGNPDTHLMHLVSDFSAKAGAFYYNSQTTQVVLNSMWSQDDEVIATIADVDSSKPMLFRFGSTALINGSYHKSMSVVYDGAETFLIGNKTQQEIAYKLGLVLEASVVAPGLPGTPTGSYTQYSLGFLALVGYNNWITANLDRKAFVLYRESSDPSTITIAFVTLGIISMPNVEDFSAVKRELDSFVTVSLFPNNSGYDSVGFYTILQDVRVVIDVSTHHSISNQITDAIIAARPVIIADATAATSEQLGKIFVSR